MVIVWCSLIAFSGENIRDEIKLFIANKKMKNIFRIKIYDSIMCGYFCIECIDFMFNGKSLTDFQNPLSALKKAKFIKEQEASRLLPEIRTPLSKISLLCEILFKGVKMNNKINNFL